MSTLSPRPRPLPPTLLPSLNALLAALALPFALDHPTDLTPSLLLAIFESLISARLPIPSAVRQSRTPEAKARAMLVLLGVLECDVLRGGTIADAEHSVAASNTDDSVLGGAGGVSVDGWVDEIGLGEVDPEQLADGGWEETIFIGELLCWLARRKGILPRTRSHRSSHPRSLYSNHHSYGTEEGVGEHEGDTADFSTSLLLRPSLAQKSRSPRNPLPLSSTDQVDANADPDFSVLSYISDVPRHPLVHSPEPSLSVSATTGTELSIRARSVSSRTSVSNMHDDPDQFEGASQDTVQVYDPRRMMQDAEEDDDQPPTFHPRCIHELQDPSYIRALAGFSSSFDPSASHERISDEDDPSGDQDDDADEQDNDDLYEPPTPTPRRVRLTGWIDPVDAATELSYFAASRAHSRSRAFNVSAGLWFGTTVSIAAAQTHPYRRALHVDAASENRSRLGPPPSPPSPPAHSDPPFDVSFSAPNNTSTPAKPRPPRRTQFQVMTTRHEIESGTHSGVDRDKSCEALALPLPRALWLHRAALPGALAQKHCPSALTTPTAPPPSTTTATRKKSPNSTCPPPTNTKGKSPPQISPPGSTATTNMLLTERARLLTELAALKRARAASGGTGTGTGAGAGAGAGVGVVGRRVGVGV
ncbi:hypothetical protein HD554DRAFT_2038766 [Boletus coccyginus]|nr:hypothetical protein HD554DRAFT_2038766 [Boletus coccyginus]